MGGRGGGGGQRLLDGFRRKEGWLGQTGGLWDDAIVMRLCRPASLGNGRTGRRSEKCSLKMLIERVAFLEAAGVSLFARPVVHFCRRTLEWTGRSKRKEKWENDRRTRRMVVDRWPQRMRRERRRYNPSLHIRPVKTHSP